MTYRVKISDCLEQFYRAHNALVDSLGGYHHLAQTSQRGNSHWCAMKQGWQKRYNATPVTGNSSWKWLDFESEQHYALFILKWS